jgi:hypothetical protein
MIPIGGVDRALLAQDFQRRRLNRKPVYAAGARALAEVHDIILDTAA